jgi:hypothetical protein
MMSSECEARAQTNPWRITKRGSGIKFESLALVGLERVSRGSWQPILRTL